MLKSRVRWIVWGFVASTSVLTGCQQVPTPTDGMITSQRPPVARHVEPPYRLAFPAVMDFTEGRESEYSIDYLVPSPGVGTIAVSGLPDGAVYDPTTSKLRWKPDYTVAGDEADPSQVDKFYSIRIELSSTADGVSGLVREGRLRVVDVLRPVTLKGLEASLPVDEGSTLKKTIEIVSPDFQSGPFAIDAEGLPAGAAILQNPKTPTQFTIEYTPSYRVSTYSTGDRHFDVSLHVLGPRGLKVDQKFSITVWDTRMKPIISSPSKVETGEVAQFVFSASDPNGEAPPRVSINRRYYPGQLEITNKVEVKGDANTLPMTFASVRWSGISAKEALAPQTAYIDACALGRNGRFDCDTLPVTVSFQLFVHPAPAITRPGWEFGKVRYLKINEPKEFAVNALPGVSRENPVTIAIQGDTDNEVSWKDAKLKISPKKVGLKTVAFTARSEFGIVSAETFSYEVLPANWSSVLILSHGNGSDAETRTALRAFPGATVYDPALLMNQSFVLALRSTVVLGTAALTAGWDSKLFEEVFASAPNILISSPRLDLLPAGVLGTDVGIDGRLQEDVTTLTLWPVGGSGFEKPKNAARLQGTLTSESAKPALLHASAKTCSPTFLLFNQQAAEVATVAMKCKRSAQGVAGSLFIAGYEWADVKLGAGEEAFLEKWMKQGVSQ